MLARVAENIYWLNRYLERVENTVRLIDAHSRMLLDQPDVNEHSGWMPLILINALGETFSKKHQSASEANVCEFLLSDEDNPGSLINSFIAIRNNLRSCRDIVPRSSYEAINGTCRFVQQQVGDVCQYPSQRTAFLSSLQTRLLAISGDISSNMSHDLRYCFMRMGCVIERADMTSRIIDVQSSWLLKPENDDENIALQQQRWASVLRSLSAMQMYRQSVRRPVNGGDTLHMLLIDDKLPRSYMYCLNYLDRALDQLKRYEAPREAIAKLRSQLTSADLPELAHHPIQLHRFLDTLQMDMQDVAEAIAATYFLPPQETR